MLISTLENYKNAYLPQNIELAIEEALPIFKNKLPEDGIYPLSNNAKAIVMRYNTKEQPVYESHTVMTDVQIILAGEEYINIRGLDGLSLTNSGEDIDFYSEEPRDYTRVCLIKGMFCVIYPKEAHAAALQVEESCEIIKVVLKVPLGE